MDGEHISISPARGYSWVDSAIAISHILNPVTAVGAGFQ
jgi:hypothetical protein